MPKQPWTLAWQQQQQLFTMARLEHCISACQVCAPLHGSDNSSSYLHGLWQALQGDVGCTAQARQGTGRVTVTSKATCTQAEQGLSLQSCLLPSPRPRQGTGHMTATFQAAAGRQSSLV